jgi:hypothetical protein
MGVAIRHGRSLRATLCEIERGVFYATYPDFYPDTNQLDTYQIGTSAAEARARIELRAHALGYETVVWTQTVKAPLFASPIRTALHEPAATYAAHGRT